MENRKSQIIELALRNIREKGYLSFSYDDFSERTWCNESEHSLSFREKEGLRSCDLRKDKRRTGQFLFTN